MLIIKVNNAMFNNSIRVCLAIILLAVTGSRVVASVENQLPNIDIDIRYQSDRFKKVNSCVGDYQVAFHRAVFLRFTSPEQVVSRLEKVRFVTEDKVVKVAHVVNNDKYYYETSFGKEEHYEQLMASKQGDEYQFYIVYYPDEFRSSQESKVIVEVVLKDGSVISKSINPSSFSLEEEYLTFNAKVDWHLGVLTTTLEQLPSWFGGERVSVNYHVSYLNEAKQTKEIIIDKDEAFNDLKFVLEKKPLSYLGVYYEAPYTEDLYESGTMTTESKVELFRAGDRFYSRGCSYMGPKAGE